MPTAPKIGPILNPIRPPPAAKLPTVKELKNVLGAWEFQSPNHTIPWKTKKPAVLTSKEIVVVKPPPKGRTGDSIRAFILKSDPTKVYFEKGGSTMPHYFGPVSWQQLPKGLPGPIMNPPRNGG
ncbi:MAG: hypothetical protein U0228_15505 [Myxococcaceae bacterium]